MRVLVTYVSPHGSTWGIARRIAERLRGHGLSADCLPVNESPPLGDYDAVVVGSAIHGRAWLAESADYVRRHADDLRQRPTWLFSVGMPGALPRRMRAWAMREGPLALSPFRDLVQPRDEHLFTGAVSRRQFALPGRVALRLLGGSYGDFRDWGEVDDWADSIADMLRHGPSGATGGDARAS